MAYVGCIAGAIPIDEYRRQLDAAGFRAVEVVDTGADLNAYAKVENQSGCCSPAMASSTLPVSSGSCCGGADTSPANVHDGLRTLLSRYDVNAYAASVKVFATKG
jgi:hypothetical protein